MGTFQIFATIGGVSFMLASLLLGARMLLLSRRTGQLPERLLGATLFLWAGTGYPMMMIAHYATGLPDAVRAALAVGNLCCGVVGLSCIAVFNWRVFRPAESWARATALSATVLVSALAVAQLWQPGLMGLVAGQKSGWNLLQQLLTPLVIGWACFESFRYFGMMRKRLALGIADPVVTERFRLWGLGMAAALMIGVIGTFFTLIGIGQSSPAYQAMIGPLGLAAATFIWLAFFPPAAFTRRVLARTGAGA